MDDVKLERLETRLREVRKEHQREGLNMIGNVDQLVHRLAGAVAQWIETEPLAGRKRA